MFLEDARSQTPPANTIQQLKTEREVVISNHAEVSGKCPRAITIGDTHILQERRNRGAKLHIACTQIPRRTPEPVHLNLRCLLPLVVLQFVVEKDRDIASILSSAEERTLRALRSSSGAIVAVASGNS